METNNEETQSIEPVAGRPAARFTGSGGLSVAIWKNKSENGIENYSVRIDRSYKVDEGKYQSTQYLRDGDLLRAEKLLQQADDWIEQDKGRQRGQVSSQGR